MAKKSQQTQEKSGEEEPNENEEQVAKKSQFKGRTKKRMAEEEPTQRLKAKKMQEIIKPKKRHTQDLNPELMTNMKRWMGSSLKRSIQAVQG
ncbi:hypothetical protein H0H92_006642 [Tricholoma furcatifolium]|nr:hypothetical protein H0H92_006642 [Tricholoma furcatifolium]